MLQYLSSNQEFLIPLIQIIGIDIVLSGDNAMVIALAARALPPEQQRKAVTWGAAAAITMRIMLTFTAVALLTLPYLKLIGSVFLLWVGIQLLDSDEGESEIEPGRSLAAAIRTILFADMVMSLDNVLGVAAAAKGSIPLLAIGLGLSIPLVIFGANILLRLMQRFPVIITIGAGLIGSSMAHAMRRKNLAGHISAYLRRPETLEAARRAGFADSLTQDIAACVKDADLVVLAMPVGAKEPSRMRIKKISIIESNNMLLNAKSESIPFTAEMGDPYLISLKQHVSKNITLTHGDELATIFSLLEWVSNQWRHDSYNAPPARATALDILTLAAQGERFSCNSYATVVTDVLLSYGYIARIISLNSKDIAYGPLGMGHVAAEVWSNSLQKWIFIDPQF